MEQDEKNLNEIHRYSAYSADGFSFNIESCGQCDSVNECLNQFDFRCTSARRIIIVDVKILSH